ncbi:MAG: tetratricopeptide repeat protein [Polyangiaceae bacterium]
MTRVHRSIRRGSGAVLLTLAVSLSLAGPASAAATAAAPTLDDANRAFGEGRYPLAAQEIQQIITQQGYSAPLLFDLGNAYLKGGEPVKALLAYERAQLLAPGNAAISANLTTARQAASVPDPSGRVTQAARALSMNTWAWLASACFWAAALALGVAVSYKRARVWGIAVATGAGLIFASALGALCLASGQLDSALVLQAAPVLVSPFDSAQSDFALTAGSSVKLLGVRDHYWLVRDAQGRSGWVDRAQVEPLIPRQS